MNVLTDPASWPLDIQLIALLMPFALGAMGIALSARIALSRDFGVLLGAVRSCGWVAYQRRRLGTLTFRARMYLVCMVAGVVVGRRLHIGRGLLDKAEVESIPRPLKIKLLLCAYLDVAALVWLIAIVGLYRFSASPA